MTLWHVTPSKNVERIRKQGLTIRKRRKRTFHNALGAPLGEPAVYFCATFHEAVRMAAKIEYFDGINTVPTTILELDVHLTSQGVTQDEHWQGQAHGWLKCREPVHPSRVERAIPLTLAMKQAFCQAERQNQRLEAPGSRSNMDAPG